MRFSSSSGTTSATAPNGAQADGGHQKVPHFGTDLLRLAGVLAERPGQLESHAGPAQSGKRIRPSRQRGMDDGGRMRQTRRRLVVIGDDQFQTEVLRHLCFGDARNAAIDRHDRAAPREASSVNASAFKP